MMNLPEMLNGKVQQVGIHFLFPLFFGSLVCLYLQFLSLYLQFLILSYYYLAILFTMNKQLNVVYLKF